MEAATLVPEAVLTTRERVARALRVGGRARVTVKALASGKHLTVLFAAKARKPEGSGYLSRATKEGRVGVEVADVVFVDGGDQAFDGWVATRYLDSGSWSGPKASYEERLPHYRWAAERVFGWALDGDVGLEAQAEMSLASECCTCGKALTDPVSIDLGQGPECRGKATGSQHV